MVIRGSWALALGLALVACSGRSVRTDQAEEDAGGPSAAGEGGTSAGGSDAIGGTSAGGSIAETGGTNAGGSVAETGGTNGGGAAGAGGSCGGTGRPSDPSAMCTGVNGNRACPLAGLTCAGLVCGLADQGTRSCTCVDDEVPGCDAGVWSCTTCDFEFANDWIKTPPDPMPPCPMDVADEVPCTEPETICGPYGDAVCACWNSPADGLSWDCDLPPDIW